MAGVFWGGGRADEVADFDEYDPTPYNGGYDIALTFGRPLPPSDETCYPISTTSSTSSSYDRPQQHGGQGYDDRRKLQSEEPHGSAAGYGGGGYARRPQPHEEEAHGYGRKGHGNDDDEQGYRKPKPAYRDNDDDDQGYRKPKPAYRDDDDDQGYRKPKPAAEYGDERPSYGRKKQVRARRRALIHSRARDARPFSDLLGQRQ
ncbi:hypothetical protein PR202_ga02713 [Eleusine coracana subsp. coracana]|uniref:Uncharacterized protein n=1 Tax=Eleusine coracana subsp. coracana TaxID=191504 RepID=A0AAV5BKH1_ELECO|nr:hypothetical protein PR202_ga02713 [Eleusine coracana subsp. coracana]